MRPSLGDKTPWTAWWKKGQAGWRASRVRPAGASRSDGEAALDPRHPARQRLSKRSRASTDRSGPGSPQVGGQGGHRKGRGKRWQMGAPQFGQRAVRNSSIVAL